MLNQILEDLLAAAPGAKASIFLDNEGESIAHAGDSSIDIKLLGAWKEIHLDHIKDISNRLGMGKVHAVLFSLDEGNELIAPVAAGLLPAALPVALCRCPRSNRSDQKGCGTIEERDRVERQTAGSDLVEHSQFSEFFIPQPR